MALDVLRALPAAIAQSHYE